MTHWPTSTNVPLIRKGWLFITSFVYLCRTYQLLDLPLCKNNRTGKKGEKTFTHICMVQCIKLGLQLLLYLAPQKHVLSLTPPCCCCTNIRFCRYERTLYIYNYLFRHRSTRHQFDAISMHWPLHAQTKYKLLLCFSFQEFIGYINQDFKISEQRIHIKILYCTLHHIM